MLIEFHHEGVYRRGRYNGGREPVPDIANPHKEEAIAYVKSAALVFQSKQVAPRVKSDVHCGEWI